MVEITNRFNAPLPLVNALARDNYTRGPADRSITQLINPPQLDVLREAHRAEETVDVSDGLWLLLGRALHLIAQQGADDQHLAEERLYATVRGWAISGAMDLQHMDGGVVITDYKFTSVWSALSDKPEWENQLNGYSWLARMVKGLKTERLMVCAILRDWSKTYVGKRRNYPVAPIAMIPIRLWDAAAQDRYIEDRVRLHQDAWRAHEWGERLPECSAEERWERNGRSVRCDDYCPVARWCEQRIAQLSSK